MRSLPRVYVRFARLRSGTIAIMREKMTPARSGFTLVEIMIMISVA
jgi:hypothetical protein